MLMQSSVLKKMFIILLLVYGVGLRVHVVMAEDIITDRTKQLEFYPCSKCHANVDKNSIVDKESSHHKISINHMTQYNKCGLCHGDPVSNQLTLIGGGMITFKQSYKVCQQCHGEKGRDWELGIHGKFSGKWNGLRSKYTCTDCHDPHDPKYGPDRPLPPPKFPKFGIRKGEHL